MTVGGLAWIGLWMLAATGNALELRRVRVRLLERAAEHDWGLPARAVCGPLLVIEGGGWIQFFQAAAVVSDDALRVVRLRRNRLQCVELGPPDRVSVAALVRRSDDHLGWGALHGLTRSQSVRFEDPQGRRVVLEGEGWVVEALLAQLGELRVEVRHLDERDLPAAETTDGPLEWRDA